MRFFFFPFLYFSNLSPPPPPLSVAVLSFASHVIESIYLSICMMLNSPALRVLICISPPTHKCSQCRYALDPSAFQSQARSWPSYFRRFCLYLRCLCLCVVCCAFVLSLVLSGRSFIFVACCLCLVFVPSHL
jgi:hypothetical protein